MLSLKQCAISLAATLSALSGLAFPALPQDKQWKVKPDPYVCEAESPVATPTAKTELLRDNIEVPTLKLWYRSYHFSRHSQYLSLISNGRLPYSVRSDNNKVKLRWDDHKPKSASVAIRRTGGHRTLRATRVGDYLVPTSTIVGGYQHLHFVHGRKLIRRLVKHDQLTVRIKHWKHGYLFFNFDLTDAERAINEAIRNCQQEDEKRQQEGEKYQQEF